jgi:hypothetical protein
MTRYKYDYGAGGCLMAFDGVRVIIMAFFLTCIGDVTQGIG